MEIKVFSTDSKALHCIALSSPQDVTLSIFHSLCYKICKDPNLKLTTNCKIKGKIMHRMCRQYVFAEPW